METMSFESLEGLSNKYGESNDCVVKALSLVTGQSYERSHNHCRLNGRYSHKGTNGRLMLKKAGVKLVQIIHRPLIHGKTVMNLRGLDPTKKYVVFTAGHVLAVIGGQVKDWTEGRQHRIKFIYECDTTDLAEQFLTTEERVEITSKKRKTRTSSIRWELIFENTDEYGDIIDSEVICEYKRKPTRVWRNIKTTFVNGRKRETLGKLCLRNLEDNTYHYG